MDIGRPSGEEESGVSGIPPCRGAASIFRIQDDRHHTCPPRYAARRPADDAAHPPVRGAARPLPPARPRPRRLPHLRRPGGHRRPASAPTCTPDDVVFSTHRGHGHALAKGVPPRELIAELFGRATGCSRGRGGSMHLFSPEVGMMGTSGIVGPCILQAAGAGYSFKLLKKTDHVAVAFFGDGAVNNGAFHEGLNLASIWKLPVLFVCENNQLRHRGAVRLLRPATPTSPTAAPPTACPACRSTATTSCAVRAAGEAAVRRARAGEGRRCSSARPTAPGRTPRAWATSPTARAKRSRTGRPAARSAGCERRCVDARRRRRPTSTRIDAEVVASRSPRRASIGRGQPLARSGDGGHARLSAPAQATPTAGRRRVDAAG